MYEHRSFIFSKKQNFAHFKKMSTFVSTLGVSVHKQAEILPFEPDF